MNAIQLEMFEENDEITLLKKEIAFLNEDINTLRRSQFARLSALGKEIIDLKQEIYSLKFTLKAKI